MKILIILKLPKNLADGHLYIVMEYCDDGDLMQKIKHQGGNLFPEDTVRKDIVLNQGGWESFSM